MTSRSTFAAALLALALAPLHVDGAPLVPERCAAENPTTWSLRFTLGAQIDVQQCLTMCQQGGGNGYFCVSQPVGTCLCGTATKPASISPDLPGACTTTCASGAACGAPGNRYSCYAGLTQPTGPCPESPATDCTTGKSSFSIQMRSETEQVVRWKWRRGAIEREAVGDPLTTTSYAACLYADGELIDELAIEPGENWYRRENGDLAFLQREGNDDGVSQLTLHPNARGRIWLEGRGANLDVTAPPLVYSESVELRLHAEDGGCWGASYPLPARRNRTGRFYDR